MDESNLSNMIHYEQKRDKKQIKPVLRIVSLLPAIVMMITIFLFSAKNGAESDGTSTPIARFILRAIEAGFGEFDSAKHASWLEHLNFIVRKTAHMTEYLVLALCVGWPLYIRKLRRFKFVIFNLMITIFYAATDEFHQTFVPGRSGKLMDVGIDSIGCILGTLLFLGISTLVYRIERKHVTV